MTLPLSTAPLSAQRGLAQNTPWGSMARFQRVRWPSLPRQILPWTPFRLPRSAFHGWLGCYLRIKIEEDFRRFPAIPRATKQFEERYKGRTAVERVNARLKIFWGADDGNVVGARRFHGHVGAVMIIHAAVALWLGAQPRWEGTPGQTPPHPLPPKLAR